MKSWLFQFSITKTVQCLCKEYGTMFSRNERSYDQGNMSQAVGYNSRLET